mmetsp:Transcript_23358/g.31281  ORF Transcript_23358/g.31281 Transcript_23358/m.31281 type:complete len:90 (+) Transcript_23358:626-895(+)|eukprot:CAMPEP_0170469376 /NCGR_PEP_ID=MMETSP0123-20130129/12224_1 /TAXON_ID=182087 /ORGANISM="Favella ehrenbergii, Strain Fehren 1" /LENGTH=89 /DNA_ID=CAMNT_0010736219 /DNA_START=614 /DNA_END=883 /DNA_ORIENTATION=-
MPEVVEPVVTNVSEEEGSAVPIALGILLPLIAIAGAIVGFLLWRRRKNRMNGDVSTVKPKKSVTDGAYDKDDEGELEVELKSGKNEFIK